MSTSAELKAAGNAAFKGGSYAEAVQQYTKAIEVLAEASGRNLAVLLANRAQARLKLEETDSGVASALEDSRAATRADSSYTKAIFREAQCCLRLGRKEEGIAALHRLWKISPGDVETEKLLRKEDAEFEKYMAMLEHVDAAMEKKREDLSAMVHRGHPHSLRTAYYATWMKAWTPEDREVALSEAFTKVLEQIKQTFRAGAKSKAIDEKERGEVTFGEDGFGVMRRVNENDAKITEEGFALLSIVLEEIVSDRSYNDPTIYCATVEAVAEKREDEARFLPEDRVRRMGALRPEMLMGPQCATHALKDWMVLRMGLNLRKQVLVAVCIHVCMAAAGLVSVQFKAKNELRNLRRQTRGLPPLQAGEESEDDEIMCKSDYEAYKQRQAPGAGEALAVFRAPSGTPAPTQEGIVV